MVLALGVGPEPQQSQAAPSVAQQMTVSCLQDFSGEPEDEVRKGVGADGRAGLLLACPPQSAQAAGAQRRPPSREAPAD